ncbi:MAG TPA: small multi-drug export protein [Candidatus Cloacimonadota bacterium]|nr:small multi-drug export protein [Candidatus Cloacimonadota bacterium]HQL14583.1 small multi-drug export protein [Candidatus Cloacimonadota bacterium]
MKKILLGLIIILLVTGLSAAAVSQNKTVQWFQDHHISPELTIVMISMLPVFELRGSIPVAMFAFHFHWFKAAVLAVIGNMLPIPLLLLFLESLVKLLRKNKLGAKFVDRLYKRTKSKSKVIERYEAIGLVIFVGIPIPGTGAWTGSLAANIFALPFWKSLFYIFVGVLLAAVAVTLLCQTGVIVLT